MMNELSFIFTVFFMLLGPIKVIPAFAKLTHDTEPEFRRAVAIRSSLLATAICAFVAFAAQSLASKYHLSVQAVQITGGLVLLISALTTIFPRHQPAVSAGAKPTPMQLALSAIATPVIVPPAGIAAIMVFVMLAPDRPGLYQAIASAIAILMLLDFLVMFFHDQIVKIPALVPLLQLFGSILIVIQIALAVQVMINAFQSLGAIRS